MGLAAKPDQLAAERVAATTPRRVVDSTPPYVQSVRRAARAIWWDYHKRQLDLLQLTAATDRQWEIARDQSLRLINEGEETLIRAMSQILGAPIQETSKEKEKP